MALVRQFGKPDLFVTFTCNPNWSEITECLSDNQCYSDRPAILARVFNLKYNEFINDITNKHALGVTVAWTYTIEFQKRGLPHAHLLIFLRDEDKFTDTRRIDNLIWAELPDPIQNPTLFELVTTLMIHGPCGIFDKQASCMDNNCCTKNYPKTFSDSTHLNNNGYPQYKRPDNNIVIKVKDKYETGKFNQLDNRWVVPYNPKLLLKYRCHINVEVCSSVEAIKYIFKYIFKGTDCAQINIVEIRDKNNQVQKVYDEITSYLSKTIKIVINL